MQPVIFLVHHFYLHLNLVDYLVLLVGATAVDGHVSSIIIKICIKLSFVPHGVQMKRLVSQLYIRDNCHPFKTMVAGWTQVPLWISLSLALRNMTGTAPFTGTGLVYIYVQVYVLMHTSITEI